MAVLDALRTTSLTKRKYTRISECLCVFISKSILAIARRPNSFANKDIISGSLCAAATKPQNKCMQQVAHTGRLRIQRSCAGGQDYRKSSKTVYP